MNKEAEGFLVVLSDVTPANEKDYFAWLTTEHAQERLRIGGFTGVRIFRRVVEQGHRYFIWYRLRNAEVVDSPAYLQRLNNPTPWSQRIMPMLGNFGRGGGEVAASSGERSGTLMLALEFDSSESPPLHLVTDVASIAGVGSAHLLITDRERSEVRTNERGLRTNNRSFASLLIAESGSEEALRKVSEIAAPKWCAAGGLVEGIYTEVFSLANA